MRTVRGILIIASIFLTGGVLAAELEPLLPVEVALPAAPEPFTSHVIHTDEKVFMNDDCEKRGTCDLLRVRYIAQDAYVIIDNSKSFASRLFAEYETSSQEALERYVFVQFIKGCTYYTTTTDTGEIIVDFGAVRRLFGFPIGVTFDFSDWIIDTIDTDPSYYSHPGYPRHYYYSWSDPVGSFDEDTRVHYGEKHPPQNRLYVIDSPTGAFTLESGTTKNVSLEFRMCIYRTADIPEGVSSPMPHLLSLPEPIDCFEWDSSFIYNYEERRFDSPEGIVSVCGQHEDPFKIDTFEAK